MGLSELPVNLQVFPNRIRQKQKSAIETHFLFWSITCLFVSRVWRAVFESFVNMVIHTQLYYVSVCVR